MLKKKNNLFAICRTRLSAPLFLNSRISPIQGMEPGTYHFPVNHSSMGLTRIEPKFNSATKAAWIGCMTLWMASRHFMKRSSVTKFNWFEFFSRPRLDSSIHCINHHLVDKCKGNQWHYLVDSDLSDG